MNTFPHIWPKHGHNYYHNFSIFSRILANLKPRPAPLGAWRYGLGLQEKPPFARCLHELGDSALASWFDIRFRIKPESVVSASYYVRTRSENVVSEFHSVRTNLLGTTWVRCSLSKSAGGLGCSNRTSIIFLSSGRSRKLRNTMKVILN